MVGETLGNTLYPGVSLELLLEMRHTESQNHRMLDVRLREPLGWPGASVGVSRGWPGRSERPKLGHLWMVPSVFQPPSTHRCQLCPFKPAGLWPARDLSIKYAKYSLNWNTGAALRSAEHCKSFRYQPLRNSPSFRGFITTSTRVFQLWGIPTGLCEAKLFTS